MSQFHFNLKASLHAIYVDADSYRTKYNCIAVTIFFNLSKRVLHLYECISQLIQIIQLLLINPLLNHYTYSHKYSSVDHSIYQLLVFCFACSHPRP